MNGHLIEQTFSIYMFGNLLFWDLMVIIVSSTLKIAHQVMPSTNQSNNYQNIVSAIAWNVNQISKMMIIITLELKQTNYKIDAIINFTIYFIFHEFFSFDIHYFLFLLERIKQMNLKKKKAHGNFQTKSTQTKIRYINCSAGNIFPVLKELAKPKLSTKL